MTREERFSFPSADGRTTIDAVKWIPENGKYHAILQISHGMIEYIDRYKLFAEFLNNHGYLVVGHNHLGHGASVVSEEEWGYFAEKDAPDVLIKDMHTLRTIVQSENTELPYFMLGHSMGSFLLRTYLFTYCDEALTGAILSGTGWQPSSLIAAAAVLSREETLRLGDRGHSKLMIDLVFGGYNKKFAPNRTAYDWVCANPEAVDAYAANPFCTWTPSIQLCAEMLRGILMIQKSSNLARMRKDLPVYFFSGQLDPVGGMGNGVLKCVQKFKDTGMRDVVVELFPDMRHECHNEVNRELVFSRLLAWLTQKI